MQFVDTLPPRVVRAPGRPAAYQEEASGLRDNPGKWGLVLTAATTKSAVAQASAIRTGGLRAFTPAGAFEATNRGSDVYARFITTTERTSL
ncbi:hypothetical protein [Nocardia sp. MW-W600-9]